MNRGVALHGAPGNACAAAAYLFPECHRHRRSYELLAYIDALRGGQGFQLDGVPDIGFEEWQDKLAKPPVFLSMCGPGAMKKWVHKVAATGRAFTDLNSADGSLPPNVRVGHGYALIQVGYTGPGALIGERVHADPMISVGHDVVIGNDCIICPSATASDHAHLEDGVFLGAGRTIDNGRSGPAMVTKVAPAGSRPIGNPAVPVRSMRGQRTPQGRKLRQRRAP